MNMFVVTWFDIVLLGLVSFVTWKSYWVGYRNGRREGQREAYQNELNNKIEDALDKLENPDG